MRELLSKYMSETLVNRLMDALEESKEAFLGAFALGFETNQEIADEVNKFDNYVAFLAQDDLRIFHINFEKAASKKYLRLGVIPKNEESFNFLTKENEAGVSVFELENESPILSNLQILDSFSGRSELPAFVVTGDLVGVGQDGEPLLKNVSYVEKTSIDFEGITVDALNKQFKEKITNDHHSKEMYRFFINGYLEIVYSNYTYSNPVGDFDLEMGL